MDSLIAIAARALAAGDALGALKRVALRNDAPALALRGIAMAQLGDLPRARALLRKSARAFGARQAVARARCVVAEAEVAIAMRELGWPAQRLDAARALLEAHGDRVNAAHARCLQARRELLIGRPDEAERALDSLHFAALPAALRATLELVAAGIHLRRLQTEAARTALARAMQAADEAAIPALTAEVDGARRSLAIPAARLISGGQERLLRLADVEALFASNAFVVDLCRHALRHRDAVVSLATRPVLFKLAHALGEAWPGDVSRQALVARAFRAKSADESYRARLRVELGRLRKLLRPLAEIVATQRGFALLPRVGSPLVVLAQAVASAHADVLALLADGQPWSSSALALALGSSQRSVQRALEALAGRGQVQCFGRGRARRWLSPPMPGFTPVLLLPAALSNA